MEAIALRVEAIAVRLEAIALGVEVMQGVFHCEAVSPSPSPRVPEF